MDTGIIHDLAVGVHPGGADAWAHQDLLVRGISVGAPPDGFNQLGQDWAQPPLAPAAAGRGRLPAAGRAVRQPPAARGRAAGGSRHGPDAAVVGARRDAAGPRRLRAVRPPGDGAARWPAQAARAGALAIGEDLGTVDPWIRDYLAERTASSAPSMLWFAREPDGTPLPPRHWRRGCMATVGTHDLPPVSGFLTGEQVTVRARLGLLNDPSSRTRNAPS